MLIFLTENMKENFLSFFFSICETHKENYVIQSVRCDALLGYQSDDIQIMISTKLVGKLFCHNHILLFKVCLYIIIYSIHMTDKGYFIPLKSKQIV